MEQLIKEMSNKLKNEEIKSVPILAGLWEIGSDKSNYHGKIFVNKSANGMSPDEKHTKHAEYLLLKNKPFKQVGDRKFNLIISTHPCKYCLKEISKHKENIKNVLYISPISAKHKRKEYENFVPKNECTDINVAHFNKNKIENVDDLNYLKNEIEESLIFKYIAYWMEFNFIKQFEKYDNILITKKSAKKNRSYINAIENYFEIRFYTDKEKYTILDLKKIRKIYNDEIRKKQKNLNKKNKKSLEKKTKIEIYNKNIT